MARKPAKKKQRAKVGSVKSWFYTLTVAALILFLFLDVAILFVIGMVPTIGAFIVDRAPKKYFTLTVAFANGTGVLPSAVKLFTGGSGGVDVAMEVATDPVNLLVMYGAGAIGWFVHYIVPPFVGIWLSMSQEMKSIAIKKRQQELIENWGTGLRDEAQKLLPDNVRLAEGIGEPDGARGGERE